jgi:hypothetical protein
MIDPRGRLACVMALLAMSFLSVTAALAQSSLVLGVQDRRLDIEASFAPDPIDNDQTSIRGTFTWELGDAWTVVAMSGAASSYLGLNDTRIGGMTDLRLRAIYRPTPEWVIGAGSVVPLGLYELTANEVTTAQWIWNPRSGFPLNRLGEGFGWEVTAARAVALTPRLSAGIAAGYLRHAEFDLLESGTGAYRLGSEMSTSIALDWRMADAAALVVDSQFRFFGADQIAGKDYVSQGNQFGIGATLELPLGAHVTRWGVRAAHKTDNELLYLTDEEAAADSIALSVAGGSTFGFEARVGRALSPSVLTYVEGAVDVVRGSDYALPTNGTAFSLGPGFGWRINDAFSVGGRLSWLHSTGTDDLDFTGRDLLLTLEYRP